MSTARKSTRSKLPSLKAELNNITEQKLKAVQPSSKQTAAEKKYEGSRENASDGIFPSPGASVVPITPPTPSQPRKTRGLGAPTPTKVKVQASNLVSTENALGNGSVLISEERSLGLEAWHHPELGVWQHFKDLCKRLPGRESQIEFLLSLFGEPSCPVPSPLYLFGNTGTGKTLTIKALLATLQVPHVVVNCVECYCSRLLFEKVLMVICNVSKSAAVTRCDNMASFVGHLQMIISGSRLLKEQTVYIVLDHAERLREQEVTLLPTLLRLKELTGCELCVLLVSEIVFEKFSTGTGLCEPLTIHFPNYSKAEALAVMCLDYDGVGSPEFFQTFTIHIWNVFHNVCRDLGELRYLSAVLYPKYREPVDSGLIGCTEPRKLWWHIQPYFKQVMGRIYLREVSTTQWERAITTPSSGTGGVVNRDHVELPRYSKYLLMAAYLASYNPAKTDRRFFSKIKQAKLRKSRQPGTQEKPSGQLLGPKPFPLDRLMAIFYSILEEDLPPSAHIYSQVSSLSTLQLLTLVSSSNSLDAPKYKCLVSLEYARAMARSIDFDIIQYLYDFK